MNPLIVAILLVVVPVVVGVILPYILKFNTFIEGLPTPIPQIFGIVFAYGVTALMQGLPGVVLPTALSGWTADALMAALTALVHILFPTVQVLKAKTAAKAKLARKF